MADFEGDAGVLNLNIPIYNWNASILALRRGQSASDDDASLKYGHFPLFPAILASCQLKKADFEHDTDVWSRQYLNHKEVSFLVEIRVNQYLTMKLIFFHFQPF